MTFLFDIGNVLLRFDYKEALLNLIPPTAGDPDVLLKNLEEKRHDLECGHIALEEFIPWALATLKSPASPADFIAAWRAIFSPIEANWQLARELHAKGHRLILFSNINAIHSPWIYEAYEIFSLFHGAVMSFEIGHMKPHPQFYQHAIEHHQLVPSETIYIDDLPANIATGREFGFHCHQYDPDSHADLEAFLSQFSL